MGTCKQLSREVDSGFDNTSDNNTSGNISDNTRASGSMFDNIGVLWKQYPPVGFRIRNHLWGNHLWGLVIGDR